MHFSSSTSTVSVIKPAAVTERLCNMRPHDALGTGEIRNRARDFKCSMVAARRETELAYRSLQHGDAICIERAMLLYRTRP